MGSTLNCEPLCLVWAEAEQAPETHFSPALSRHFSDYTDLWGLGFSRVFKIFSSFAQKPEKPLRSDCIINHCGSSVVVFPCGKSVLCFLFLLGFLLPASEWGLDKSLLLCSVPVLTRSPGSPFPLPNHLNFSPFSEVEPSRGWVNLHPPCGPRKGEGNTHTHSFFVLC